jgi:uncharacterized protein YqhQ
MKTDNWTGSATWQSKVLSQRSSSKRFPRPSHSPIVKSAKLLKTINAFEAGADLKPETVKNFPLEHPRCGTSFLLTLIVLSVLVFSLVGNLPFGFLLLSRVLLIPVLAMLAYEYIRFTANHLDHPFIRWMIRPNLALQSLTTREPDLDILEVSIASFNAMLELEKKLQPRAIHPTTEPSPAGGGGGYQNPPE